ncbi:chloride channel protein [Paenibacillus glycanilyticus]|uniref:chloride channel protein n=1 Tax=Paenibacillus glycanilyticus TaxID=126569 RepID=UPI003EBFFD87
MLASLHRKMSGLLSEQVMMMIYAAIIGLGGGYGAIGFRKLIELLTHLFYGRAQNALQFYEHGARTLIMPAAGGLLVGLLVYYFAREAKGHGVPEVMFAVAEKKGIIRPRIVIAKALASAMTIGSGGSAGREGPIVQIGSAGGSVLGQILCLKERNMKILVACGAAAGVAGTFNAPLGGLLFASEIILGSFSLTQMSFIAISSVLSTAIGRLYMGNVPSFPIPHYEVNTISTLGLFILLGVFGGFVSLIYLKSLLFFEVQWERLERIPEWVKPALGGLAVGLVGYIYPQVLGVGYPTVESALGSHLGLGILIVLMLAKLLATTTTIASGGSGGVFAPGLYIGAMLGAAFGIVCQLIFPELHVNVGAFAVAGMASIFAGTAHAPITAMVMLFEMTGNYEIILPLILCTVVSSVFTSKINRESIYTMKLMKRGFDLIKRRSPDKLNAIRVAEAIHPELITLRFDTSISQAKRLFQDSHDHLAYVRNENDGIVGAVSRDSLLVLRDSNLDDKTIKEILYNSPLAISSNKSIGEASSLLREAFVNYLLVIDNESNPIGIIDAMDIVKACQHVGE